jgi:1-deoxy-D-xylulose-5-phosphate synthase
MINSQKYPLLSSLDLPEGIKGLSQTALQQLADEVRAYLIEIVPSIGGHFAAGLGTVELTVALHHLYSSPDDKLVWDVGHQAYPHKILTGRAAQLNTIRQLNGLAPFPDRQESIHDAFGVGHSSTSISAALGMQIAFDSTQQQRNAVAIIGDGGMTAGMAFEALNHAGECKANVLVILNDNEMSISPNVGALSSSLTKMISGQALSAMREEGKRVLRMMPEPIWDIAKKAEEHVKGMVLPGTLFEEFGFNYFGPIDGHDIPSLIQTIGNLKKLSGPRLLHITTKKGKGYAPAEAEPVKYHGVGKFDPAVGIPPPTNATPNNPSYSSIFGQWLIDTAEQDSKLMAITPAMMEGSGMVKFAQQFPQQFCDVAIAEQHSVTVAAGMAAEGLKPVVAIYSSFLQRAYDQLIHDVALQNLAVVFAIDRAGLVGPDGGTHSGSYDFSFLRPIPNMIIMAPANENEARLMLNTGYQYDGPSAIRYPRGKGNCTEVTADITETLEIGTAVSLREGNTFAILAFGSMCDIAKTIGEQLNATVVNMRFVKPIDLNTIQSVSERHDIIITLEENVIAGGAGSAIAEALATLPKSKPCDILHIGLPDSNLPHGSREELLTLAGLTEEKILATIKSRFPEQVLAAKPVSQQQKA